MRQWLLLLMFLSLTANADDRLLGTWKSDREASMRFNSAHAVLEPKQAKFLNQILGHLEITFEASRVRNRMPDLIIDSNGKPATFHGTDEAYDYRILGSDVDSVAIYVEKLMGRDRVLHYHFVGDDTFWIYTEESNYGLRDLNAREYFHRE